MNQGEITVQIFSEEVWNNDSNCCFKNWVKLYHF
jgi:hypothetical protein